MSLPEILHETFRELFPKRHNVLNDYGKYLNSVNKLAEAKYLMLCRNSTMYLLLTSSTIMYYKVLGALIMKLKSFMKYLKGGLEMLIKFMKCLNISQ